MIGARLAERVVRDLLGGCDVEVGGRRPWDLLVHDRAFYRRVLLNPGLQVGETYLDGLWDCEAQDELFFRVLSSPRVRRLATGGTFLLREAWARLTNRQSRARARQVVERHYDADVELYRGMLDDTMTYTCAVWQEAASAGDSLAEAQRRKLRLVCTKLALRPGETLLDIGCGFGGLAELAAAEYGARVVGITNSRHHWREAQRRAGGRGDVEILELDYRDLPALGRRFDKIASIEMIEAVGPRNYATYMDVVARSLAPGGRVLVQSFLSDTSQHVCNEWFDRHVFPNGVTPSLAQLGAAARDRLGPPRDVEELGAHYPPTLRAWDANLRDHWPALGARYGERDHRLWRHYLTCLAGTFRAGHLRLAQVLYEPAPRA
jgi:cyclopropane-fatty-acyl-phospholipid synthase